MSSDAPDNRARMEGKLDAAQRADIESGYMLCFLLNFWGSQIVESLDQLTTAYRKVNAPPHWDNDPHPDR